MFLSVLGYAFLYAAYEQGFGEGGSVLYWLLGNPNLGAPSTGSSSSSGGGGGGSAAQSGQLPKNPTGAKTFPGGVGSTQTR